MFGCILVAIDGSGYSLQSAKYAAQLAKITGAKLVLFHAAPHIHMPFYPDIFMAPYTRWLDKAQLQKSDDEATDARDARVKKLFADTRRELGFDDLAVVEIFEVSDHPNEAILETAKKHYCDLIVMAPHGQPWLESMFIGSETLKVLTQSPIPVLVVK